MEHAKQTIQNEYRPIQQVAMRGRHPTNKWVIPRLYTPHIDNTNCGGAIEEPRIKWPYMK